MITRSASVRAGASHSVAVRSGGTALASPSQSRTRVPPGTAGERSRGVRPALRPLGLFAAGLVELVLQGSGGRLRATDSDD